MSKPKLVLSFDVEATGDSPANGSCVMLGITARIESVPVSEENRDWIIYEREWCMQELDGRSERCWEEFWLKHQDVWEYIQAHSVHPTIAMKELSDFIAEISEKYDWYWVAWPAAFDWQWLKYTYDKYGPSDRAYIGYKAQCMNAYQIFAEILGVNKDEFKKYIYPNELWLQMSHNALDDARNQAYIHGRMQEFYAEWKKINVKN